MKSLNEMQVNVRSLIDKSSRHGWGYACLAALTQITGQQLLTLPLDPKTLPSLLPETVDYAELRPFVSGGHLLDLVECLEGVDAVRTGGVVLLSLANNVFLPHLPATHPARQPSEDLLASLRDYLLHGTPAETYIGTAFRFRSQYGTTCTAIGSDPAYEMLFDALPTAGLDCAIGENCWDLYMHWNSYGIWLASQDEGWKALCALEEDLLDEVLVAGEDDADREARSNASQLIQSHRECYVEAALDDVAEQVENLVDEILASLFSTPVQAA